MYCLKKRIIFSKSVYVQTDYNDSVDLNFFQRIASFDQTVKAQPIYHPQFNLVDFPRQTKKNKGKEKNIGEKRGKVNTLENNQSLLKNER